MRESFIISFPLILNSSSTTLQLLGPDALLMRIGSDLSFLDSINVEPMTPAEILGRNVEIDENFFE